MEQINNQQSTSINMEAHLSLSGEEAGCGAKRPRAAGAAVAKVGETPAAGRRPKRWVGGGGEGLGNLG